MVQQIPPLLKIYLQADGAYVELPWDATTSLSIPLGSSTGTFTHKGVAYSVASASMPPPVFANPTPVPDGWTALTLVPGDDINAALAKRAPGATLTISSGDYGGQFVAVPKDLGLIVPPEGADELELVV